MIEMTPDKSLLVVSAAALTAACGKPDPFEQYVERPSLFGFTWGPTDRP